ncbi:energy-coupling factor transporter transmembrane component T family protein [Nesterenkonia alba]|uniref:energy-coupling factor transporter transmembrane component T family protein n=1 Tax=Nesterenkonia alba TaxID=515814 RepID=UPI0003B53088|nr:energy-coupling factor transporter transmembrane protein EcfT [Nesterenkonia alba]
MIPLYRPGRSPLHRIPAGVKLLGLLLLGIIAAVFGATVWVTAGAWVVVVAGFLLAHPGTTGLCALAARLWTLKWLLVLIAVPQLVFLTVEEAVVTTARVVAIILLAGLVTLTTRVSDVMELIRRGVTPLEQLGLARLGVTAERLSLAMSLTMRSVPVVFSFYDQIREARRARGVKPGLGSTVGATTPLLVMTLKHADETSEALVARGMR